MKTVGIKNLKNSLSEYIRMVKAGESIFITEHNRIVAEIIPSCGSETDSTLLEKYINEQDKKGWILKSTRKTKLKKKKKKLAYDKKVIDDIYSETRDER